MVICELPEKEFQIILLKKFHELHEHTDLKLSEIQETMQE